jgi:hypothetical protein
MDAASIAGTSLMMKLGQTQQAISMSLMKQAADQQQLMANLLEQNAKQGSQLASQTGTNFSVYA